MTDAPSTETKSGERDTASGAALEHGQQHRNDAIAKTPRSAATPLASEASDAQVSIRSWSTARNDPPPPSMSKSELEELAKKRVGSTISGFRLAHLLGVGPVCAAFESFRSADDSGEHVVLKLMLGNVAKHERARAMLLRAAYASNRFSHPRVLSVTGDGTDGEGAPFVLRPWLDVETLDEFVGKSETGMSEAKVLRVAEQVLDALEIAHSHGIVHGAITPRNILVTPRSSIRLCDFSVPPGMGPRTSDDEDVLATRRIGPFSAPERCGQEPGPASEQTDIYMLAACMYLALSKETPRGLAQSADDLATTRARPIRSLCPHVSEYVAMLVDHALALSPEGRFDSAYAMLGDVRRVMAGRKPKLGEARRPVPTGSFSAPSLSGREGTPSSRRPVQTLRNDLSLSSSTARRYAHRSQAAGNVALILAIALLVGVATFVMVREKVEESRVHEQEELEKKQPKEQVKQKPVTPP